jgi:hypothetical protein
MAKPNYSYGKRQRELKKKKKQEEKRQRRMNKGKPDEPESSKPAAQ